MDRLAGRKDGGRVSEAKITINGQELTEAQAMTLRAAVTGFMADLAENGLGDDEHGKRMCKAYLQRGNEILFLLMGARTGGER